MSASRHNKQLSNYLASHKAGKFGRNNVASDSSPARGSADGLESAVTEHMKVMHLHNDKSLNHQGQQLPKSQRKSAVAGSSKSRGSDPLKTGSPKSRGVDAKKGLSAYGSVRRRATIDDLPDEVLLKLLGYLPADSLVTCAFICKRWYRLANSNSLWERLYHVYAARKNEPVGHRLQSADATDPDSNWKTKCIRKCIERRDARVKTMLNKSSPYTHLPANTEKAVQKFNISWELVLRDKDKTDHVFRQSDSFHLPTSSTVRWYHLQFPPVKSLRGLSVIARVPVFFNRDGSPAENSPCQRSLLLQHDLRWHKLSTNHPPDAQDDLIDVRVIGHCILVATWKDGGELAFISACLHNHGLVQRSTLGSPNRAYSLPPCTPKPDDIDPEYGLHDYTCIVELRNQRSVIWGQQFKNVHCSEQSREDRFARLVPVRPDVDSDHSYASKKLQLPWKTDLFKGIIQNFCILDVTLHDEFLKPFWCLSCPVTVKKADDSVVNYSYDGDPYVIDYHGDKGFVKINLIWDHDREQFAVTGIRLDVALDAINAWFSTHY